MPSPAPFNPWSWLVLALAAAQRGAPSAGPAAGAPATPIQEVVQNLRAEPLGAGMLEDLSIPDELLQRIADRILRESFEQHFRAVLRASAESPGADAGPGAGPQPDETGPARGAAQRVLDGLALAALAVLVVLGITAWRVRARRRA
jgi:hypothetical protein